jgi:hypothetical protein
VREADAIALGHARRCLAIRPDNVTALQTAVVACVTLGHLAEAAGACAKLLACPNRAARSRADLVQLQRTLGAR